MNDHEEIDVELRKVDEIFGDTVIDSNAVINDTLASYPEQLLQITDKGNKLYTAYQRHSRQFMEGSNDQVIVRWRHSSIDNINNMLIEQTFLGNKFTSTTTKEKKNYTRPTSSALFSWSSTDEYIQRRKRELMLRGRKVNGNVIDKDISGTKKDGDEMESNEHLNLIKKLGITLPNDKIINQLSYVVDTEANKFIHERIQIIKGHHSQRISEMISERKRKDHEIHLQRLKQKEEEYEKELKIALDDKKDKGFGFLGGIFNFNNSDQHHNVNHNDNMDDSSIHDAIDVKSKRFSFLPNKIFSSKEIKDSGSKNTTTPKDSPSKTKNIVTKSSNNNDITVEFEVPESPTKSQPANIASEDLDLVFKLPDASNKSKQGEGDAVDDDDDFDEFAEFTSSPPPPSPPPLPEKAIKNHKLMKMSEPTPLINLDETNPNDDETIKNNAQNSQNEHNDLLIL